MKEAWHYVLRLLWKWEAYWEEDENTLNDTVEWIQSKIKNCFLSEQGSLSKQKGEYHIMTSVKPYAVLSGQLITCFWTCLWKTFSAACRALDFRSEYRLAKLEKTLKRIMRKYISFYLQFLPFAAFGPKERTRVEANEKTKQKEFANWHFFEQLLCQIPPSIWNLQLGKTVHHKSRSFELRYLKWANLKNASRIQDLLFWCKWNFKDLSPVVLAKLRPLQHRHCLLQPLGLLFPTALFKNP